MTGNDVIEEFLQRHPSFRRYPKEELALQLADRIATAHAQRYGVEKDEQFQKWKDFFLPPRGWEKTLHDIIGESKAGWHQELGRINLAAAQLLPKISLPAAQYLAKQAEDIGKKNLLIAAEKRPFTSNEFERVVGRFLGSAGPQTAEVLGTLALTNVLLGPLGGIGTIGRVAASGARYASLAAEQIYKEKLLNRYRPEEIPDDKLLSTGALETLRWYALDRIPGRLFVWSLSALLRGAESFIYDHNIDHASTSAMIGALEGFVYSRLPSGPRHEETPRPEELFTPRERKRPAESFALGLPRPTERPSPERPSPEAVEYPVPLEPRARTEAPRELQPPPIEPTAVYRPRPRPVGPHEPTEVPAEATEVFPTLATPPARPGLLPPSLPSRLTGLPPRPTELPPRPRPLPPHVQPPSTQPLDGLYAKAIENLRRDPERAKQHIERIWQHLSPDERKRAIKVLQVISGVPKEKVKIPAPKAAKKIRKEKPPKTEVPEAETPPKELGPAFQTPSGRFLYWLLSKVKDPATPTHPETGTKFVDRASIEQAAAHFGVDANEVKRILNMLDETHRVVAKMPSGDVVFRVKDVHYLDWAHIPVKVAITKEQAAAWEAEAQPPKPEKPKPERPKRKPKKEPPKAISEEEKQKEFYKQLRSSPEGLFLLWLKEFPEGEPIDIGLVRRMAAHLGLQKKGTYGKVIAELEKQGLISFDASGDLIPSEFIDPYFQKDLLSALGIWPHDYDVMYMTLFPGFDPGSLKAIKNFFKRFQSYLHWVNPVTISKEHRRVWQQFESLLTQAKDLRNSMYDRHSINRELFLRNNKQVNDKIFEYLDENNPLERKHLEDELNPIESRIAEYYKGFYEGIRQMLEKEGIHWEDRGHYVYHAYVDSRYDVPWWEIDPKFRLGQPSKPRDFPKAEEVLRKWPHLKLYADGNLEAIARLYAYRAFLSLGRSKALEYLRKAGMAKIAEEKTASEFDVTMYPNEVRSPIGQRYFLTNDGLELYNRAFMAPQMSPVASQFIRGLWGIKRVSMPISFSLGAMAHGFHMAYSTFMYESRGVHWMKALSNLFTTELRKKAPGVVDYFYGRKKLEDLNQWERSIVGHLEDAGIPVTHRESVLQELGEFAGPLTRERFEQIYGKTFGKLYEQLDRLGFFKLQNFVFSEMVPLYKIQWALNRIEEMYRREPHLHKELPEYWDRMAKIRDMALDWFGEASWDIHAKAWDPVLSRSLGAMMVSLPWQIGFFRRVGRQAGYLWKLAHGERLNWLETQEFLGNLVYAITLPTIIAGINYYNTGELPKKLEDFLDIKTTKNEDGSWNAISPITYHKELFHIRNIGRYPSLWSLWESFSSKVTPFWRSVIELATNRDFLGHPVYPEDWTVDQRKRIEAAWLAIEHVLESATPLPIENLIHRVREGREASPWEAVSGVLGFRPTRITIYDSPVYEEVSKLWSAYGIKSHSFEAGEHARAIRELIQARDRGDTLTATRIVAEHPDLAKEFEGPNQEKRVHRMFRELPPEWQRYILKKYGFTPEAQELMKLAPKWLRNEVMQETVPGEERVEEEAPTS